MQGTTKGVPIDRDSTFASASDALVPSQLAVKTYADTKLSPSVTSSMTVLSASYALTASLLLGSIVSSSYALSSSYSVSSSVAGNITQYTINQNLGTSNQVAFGGVTSSLFGTSSWANNLVGFDQTNYVQNSSTSSFVVNSQTSSFVVNSQTSSFVVNSQTSSFVLVSQTSSMTVLSSSYSLTSSYVVTSLTASYVLTSQTASYVSLAQTASYVVTSQTASYVLTAQTASYVVTAQTASYVLSAVSASNARTSSGVNGGTSTYIPVWTSLTTISSSAMLQLSGAYVLINTTSATPTNPEALFINSTTASFNLVTGKGNINNYLQVNISNANTGTSASTDFVATNNVGTETSFFIDMGINNNTYINNGNGIGTGSDAYLYSTAKGLYIGNLATGSLANVYMFAGGPPTTAGVGTDLFISSSGRIGIMTLTPQYTLDVSGSANVWLGLTISGSTTASIISASSTLTVGNIAANGGSITSTATTYTLLNSVVTTLDIGGAATNIKIGSTNGTTGIGNRLIVSGSTTGINQITGSTTFSGSYNSDIFNMSSGTGAVTFSFGKSNVISHQRSGILTASFANGAQGGRYLLMLSTTGNFPVSWSGGNIKWATNATYSCAATASGYIDIISVVCSGSNYYAIGSGWF